MVYLLISHFLCGWCLVTSVVVFVRKECLGFDPIRVEVFSSGSAWFVIGLRLKLTLSMRRNMAVEIGDVCDSRTRPDEYPEGLVRSGFHNPSEGSHRKAGYPGGLVVIVYYRNSSY